MISVWVVVGDQVAFTLALQLLCFSFCFSLIVLCHVSVTCIDGVLLRFVFFIVTTVPVLPL